MQNLYAVKARERERERILRIIERVFFYTSIEEKSFRYAQ